MTAVEQKQALTKREGRSQKQTNVKKPLNFFFAIDQHVK